MALTKADMTESLFGELGLNKREARELVDTFFEDLRTALETGEQVKLSGFGNFDLRDKDPDKKPNIHVCKQILPKGSLVVFPSFVWHRVKPVTSGTRYSLVIWNLGRPFK